MGSIRPRRGERRAGEGTAILVALLTAASLVATLAAGQPPPAPSPPPQSATPAEAGAARSAAAQGGPDSLAAPADSLDAAGAKAIPDSDLVPAKVPWGPGERLVFSIDYGPVNAGEGTLEVRGVEKSAGHPCYVIESRAASNRFFSTFYMVRDKVTSFIDVHYLYSRFFAKRLREGDYRQNIEVRFDQDGGHARYADGRTFDTIRGVQDVLSAFYYVRTLDLAPGRTYEVTTHNVRKDYPLQVIVHRRERVKVPAGEFDCVVVEPKIIGEGLFQHEGELTIWLTDDARRVPVLMKTRVKVGSIDASLKEYVPGKPLR